MREYSRSKPKKDQRGEREDDAGSDGLTRVAGGLHDVVLENGSAAEHAQDADGEHGDGNGGGDGEPGAQAHVNRDRAEDETEEAAQKESRAASAQEDFTGRNEGLEVGHAKLQGITQGRSGNGPKWRV